MSHKSLETFIRLFLNLDKNNDEVIDRNELLNYCKDEGLPSDLVNEWMTRFDSNNDNVISLEEFCRGFGLNIDDMRKEKKEMKREQAGEIDDISSEIEIISTTMSKKKQSDCCTYFKNYLDKTDRSPTALRQAASAFKEYLDSEHGRVWQVIILNDPFNECGESKNQGGLVHIRVQQRNGRKMLTTVQGIPPQFCLSKIGKACKREFACNGTVIDHPEYGQVLQFQGDQREKLRDFIIKVKLVQPNDIKIHGF